MPPFLAQVLAIYITTVYRSIVAAAVVFGEATYGSMGQNGTFQIICSAASFISIFDLVWP